MRRVVKKNLFLCFVCYNILSIIMISSFYYYNDFVQRILFSFSPMNRSDECNIHCYEKPCEVNEIQEFNSSTEEKILKFNRSIFFHETSCFVNRLILNARQACAVESAARINTNMTVYFLFLTSSKVSNSSKALIQQLLTYENIKIRRININNYIKNSPLEQWYNNGIWKTSNWLINQRSNILRYVTLWKYGGIYLDLDIVVTKSLEGLNNFAGAESSKNINSAVMGFGKENVGRKVAEFCLTELMTNFVGNVWGNNGPGVITRVLQKICSTEYPSDMSSLRCEGFKVFPPSTFYPINFDNWKRYFTTEKQNETMKLIKESTTIHLWNYLSKGENIFVGSQVPYALTAKKYCPKVYHNCGITF